MAAVLDALAPYVKKLITDMAEEEVSMLPGYPAISPSWRTTWKVSKPSSRMLRGGASLT